MFLLWKRDPKRQRHVFAFIEHRYLRGGSRRSDRRFHLLCFEKFKQQGGRRFNLHTQYAVMRAAIQLKDKIFEVLIPEPTDVV